MYKLHVISPLFVKAFNKYQYIKSQMKILRSLEELLNFSLILNDINFD